MAAWMTRARRSACCCVRGRVTLQTLRRIRARREHVLRPGRPVLPEGSVRFRRGVGQRGGAMQRWDELDRYLIITSDAHAGATMVDYKPYLDRRWHDEFDAWVAGITNPWADLVSEQAKCNWDSDARLKAMDADGVAGEIIFPNPPPPLLDILAHLPGVPRDRDTLELEG